MVVMILRYWRIRIDRRLDAYMVVVPLRVGLLPSAWYSHLVNFGISLVLYVASESEYNA